MLPKRNWLESRQWCWESGGSKSWVRGANFTSHLGEISRLSERLLAVWVWGKSTPSQDWYQGGCKTDALSLICTLSNWKGEKLTTDTTLKERHFNFLKAMSSTHGTPCRFLSYIYYKTIPQACFILSRRFWTEYKILILKFNTEKFRTNLFVWRSSLRSTYTV